MQMKRVLEAVDGFKKGNACSQAILTVYGESFGLGHEKALRIAAGFAGGMRLGETCGAVTGAYMVMGLCFGSAQCETQEGRQKVYQKIEDFTARFEKKNGSILCKKLLDCDISTTGGLNTAKEKDLFNNICPQLVRDAAEIIEDMIKKEGTGKEIADSRELS